MTRSGSKRSQTRATRATRTAKSAKAAKAAQAPKAATPRAGSRTDPAVTAFIRELEHPRKPQLEALRQLILGVSPEIREGLKWNAPSFRLADDFATTNVHARDRLRLILHTGAKVKGTARTGLQIDDPTGLLEWRGKDRCLVTIADARDFEAKRGPLAAIVRQWIRQL